jgi:uncharacterized membrane protein YgcG
VKRASHHQVSVLFFTILIGVCSFCARSENAGAAAVEGKPPVPKLESWVNDEATVLSAEDQARLVKLLKNYRDETKHQIVVLIVPTLGDETIENFSHRTFSAWRLGRKGINDGILVCLAMKERQVRIALGTGMERYISNAEALKIIEEEMTPAFKRGDFAGGLEKGLKRLMAEGRRFVAANTIWSRQGGFAFSITEGKWV